VILLIRNQFTHLESVGLDWSLEVSGIPEIAALMAQIIGDLLGAGWGFRHQNRAWRTCPSRPFGRGNLNTAALF
jgi:hypothetical protein